MSDRKIKVNGVMQAVSLDKSKKYKYDKSGSLVEATVVGNDDIVFAGSKSSLRRIADLERNVSILASKLTTTEGASTDSDDDSYNNIVAEDARFRSAVRIDGTATFNGSMTFGSDAKSAMLAAIKTVDGSGSGLDADLLDGQTASYFATAATATSLQTQINNILSNTDATALNSLAELVTAFQAADSNLSASISNLASTAAGARSALEARVAALEAKLALVTSVSGGIRVAGTVTATGDVTAFGA